MNYKELNLAQLYLLCAKRGINDFFPKMEDEIIVVLKEYDEENGIAFEEKTESVAKAKPKAKVVKKPKKAKKQKEVVLEADELEIVSDNELEDNELEIVSDNELEEELKGKPVSKKEVILEDDEFDELEEIDLDDLDLEL